MDKSVSSMLDTPNGVHHVRTVGSGFPLMVIPGGPALGAGYLVWSLRGILSPSCSLMFLDQRGSGDSPVGTGPLTVEAFAADMAGVLDSAGIEKTDLFAHSFGALQTILFAAQFPDRVRRIVLSEAMPPIAHLTAKAFGPGTPRDLRREQADDDGIARLRADPRWMFDEDKLKRWVAMEYRWMYLDPSMSERIPVEMDGDGYLQFKETEAAVNAALGNDYDFTSHISSINSETLLIYTSDSILGTAAANTYHELLPRSELTWLEGGHLPSAEDPDAFESAVTSFLTRRP